MALILTITTGRIPAARAEAFQVTFRSVMGQRFGLAPFLVQSMLVHLGEDLWQIHTVLETRGAARFRPENDVPMSVQVFRDFGCEPEIQLAEISALLQPSPATRPSGPSPSSGPTTSEPPGEPTAPREPPLGHGV